MPKLTAEQIETTITQSHADILAVLQISQDPRVIDPCVTRELRACFTAGHDHGQAVMLERAESLVSGSVVDAQALQSARSLTALASWVDKGDQLLEIRSYSVRRTVFTDPEKAWAATAHQLAAAHQVHGSSHAEAVSKLATWCAERSL